MIFFLINIEKDMGFKITRYELIKQQKHGDLFNNSVVEISYSGKGEAVVSSPVSSKVFVSVNNRVCQNQFSTTLKIFVKIQFLRIRVKKNTNLQTGHQFFTNTKLKFAFSFQNDKKKNNNNKGDEILKVISKYIVKIFTQV